MTNSKKLRYFLIGFLNIDRAISGEFWREFRIFCVKEWYVDDIIKKYK
jgi:hypothetical protein